MAAVENMDPVRLARGENVMMASGVVSITAAYA
jgi:hypothetical protein